MTGAGISAESGVPTFRDSNGLWEDHRPEDVATPDEPGRKLLTQATQALRLSARGYHRVLRVARTLADLEGSAAVTRLHIAEALSYRRQAPVN